MSDKWLPLFPGGSVRKLSDPDRTVEVFRWPAVNPLADFIEAFPDVPWAVGCASHGILDTSDPEDKSTQAMCAACREVVQP